MSCHVKHGTFSGHTHFKIVRLSSRAFNISQSDPYLQLLGYLDKPVCSSNTLLNADKDQEILKANISLENLFSDFNH